MTTIINGSSPSITFSDGSAQTSATRPFQNRLINGNFVIDQRNAGASVTPDNSYTLDRWFVLNSQTSKLTVQQSSTAPVGFSNSLLVTSSSAYSVVSGDYFSLGQRIEGFNTADLMWGTANAKTVTLSFWVRSSLTGTFGGSLRNSAGNRSYPFTYSISSANTFEYKTVTITGDTSGTWIGATNGIGIEVDFGLGAGSTYSGTAGAWAGANYISATGATSVVGTNGATFYITGVQLEVGSTATSFDYRPIGTELQLCQRYAIVYGRDQAYNQIGSTGFAYGTTNGDMPVSMPVPMRTTPTLTTSGNFQISDGAAAIAITALSLISSQSSTEIASIRFTVASGATAFRPYRIETNNSTSANVVLSSEL